MPNLQDNAAWKEYAKKRLDHTRELAREKREAEAMEQAELFNVASEVFTPPDQFLDIEVENPFVKGIDRPYFFLNEEKIQKAERENKWLRFTWQIQGMEASSVFSPAQWRKGAMPREQVFKDPDRPMRCLGNFLERE